MRMPKCEKKSRRRIGALSIAFLAAATLGYLASKLRTHPPFDANVPAPTTPAHYTFFAFERRPGGQRRESYCCAASVQSTPYCAVKPH